MEFVRLFFSNPTNTPFLYALAIVVGISVVVLLGALFGSVFDADIDGAEGPLDSISDFLGISAMPTSIFAVIGAMSFFLWGFTMQYINYLIQKALLPGWVIVLIAIPLSLMVCRFSAQGFRKLKLSEDSSAVHSSSFVGTLATIVSGIAKKGLPAQAKFSDEFKQTHYVLVEPMEPGKEFHPGELVVLLKQQGPKFLVVGSDPVELEQLDLTQLINDKNA